MKLRKCAFDGNLWRAERRRNTALAILFLFALAIGLTRAADSGSDQLALAGATVITATGDAPIPDAVVLMENGKIKSVGPRAAVSIPAGIKTLDVRGKFITPGLIDTNAHLVLMTVPEFFVKYEDRFEDIALESAQVGLKYGVTTIGDSWGPLEPLLKARARLNSGEVLGSRVLIAGNIVGIGGPFSPYMMNGWPIRGIDIRYGGWVHPEIEERINNLWEANMGPQLLAMTPGELSDAMKEYVARGPDFVKVAVSAHGISPVEPLMFSPDQLKAMREEVRKAGLPFQTHTFTLESLKLAISMEPTLLQHPNVMQPMPRTPRQLEERDRLIAEIKRKNIYCALMMIPTQEQFKTLEEWKPGDHPNDAYLNEIMMGRQAGATDEIYKARVAALRPWLDAKVQFTLATDAGLEVKGLGPVAWGRLGRIEFERMEGLQEAGATPMEVLMGATRRGAEAYGLGDELGTLQAGKIADLLVLDADPLEDIHNFRKINSVIKDGRVVNREALPTIRVADFYDPSAAWPN
ncbi:MAG TPA: amidohydrolase family protein [Candidatus Acidoferrales bacterium]|nr:amidohydrolase family protein [Candidatus Acidoferrales bacterium]